MYIAEFCETLNSDHTRRAYQKDLRLFDSRTDASLPSVGQEAVRSFLADLQDREEATSTIQRRLSALRSFYDWMQEADHCSHNPARGVQPERSSPEDSTPMFDVDALQTLIASVDESTERDVRARALILIVLYGALRRGPLATLNVEDVRPLGRRWVIDLSSDDGRGGYIPIPSSAVEAVDSLKDAFAIEHDPLWRSLSNRSYGERLSADALYQIVRRTGRDAGLDTTVTIDRLRTSGLNLALAAGAHPDDVRAHSRLQDPRSVANHFKDPSGTTGLRRDVPARIEDELFDSS